MIMKFEWYNLYYMIFNLDNKWIRIILNDTIKNKISKFNYEDLSKYLNELLNNDSDFVTIINDSDFKEFIWLYVYKHYELSKIIQFHISCMKSLALIFEDIDELHIFHRIDFSL
jgi:hypothetical protein